MRARVEFDAGARRRLGASWGAEAGDPGRGAAAGGTRVPRAWASFAFFLAIGLFVGILHEARGGGFLSHAPGRGAVAPGAPAAGRELRGSEVDVRAVLIATALGLGSVATAQDGCAVIVQWGSPDTGGFEHLPQTPLAQIALNYSLGVGLDASGSVHCWGSPDIRGVSPTTAEFVKVAAGTDWGLGLRGDGTIAAWGGNGFGQCNVPSGRFRDIAAGDWHSLGLTLKGQPISWGSSNFGLAQTPQVTLDVVATGNWHSLGIKPDGLAVAWGWNEYGQTAVPIGIQFQSVAGGWKHSVGIRSDGTIMGWGSDEYQCISEIPAGSDFVQIDSNGGRSIALRVDGSAVLWGVGDTGMPRVPEAAPQRGFSQIAIGGYVAAGLLCPCPADFVDDGTVNAADLGVLLNFWGTDGSEVHRVDLDGDGIVGGGDLAVFLSAWGPCP